MVKHCCNRNFDLNSNYENLKKWIKYDDKFGSMLHMFTIDKWFKACEEQKKKDNLGWKDIYMLIT